MDAPPLRWGILGTGWIADRFVTALHESTRQVEQAVGSRSAEGARRAADACGATACTLPLNYHVYLRHVQLATQKITISLLHRQPISRVEI